VGKKRICQEIEPGLGIRIRQIGGAKRVGRGSKGGDEPKGGRGKIHWRRIGGIKLLGPDPNGKGRGE